MIKTSNFKWILSLLFVVVLLVIAGIGLYDFIIPSQMSLYTGQSIPDYFLVSIEECTEQSDEKEAISASVSITPPSVENKQAQAKFLGMIPLKNVDIQVYKDIRLYPGGMPFGVKFFTQGVLVVGITEVDTELGAKNPAYEGGLRIKDIIIKMNGKEVNTVDEVSKTIEECNGKPITITFLRNNVEQTITVSPLYSVLDQKFKTGIWVRDSTAGIGTVTFINPNNNAFAGLGHGICDIDTGELMPLMRGTVVDVTINGINKGKTGSPGELKGYFNAGKTGALIGNTNYGVYGLFSSIPVKPAEEPLPIALKQEVTEGAAHLYCTTDGNKMQKYAIEIERIQKGENDVKNFIVKITDPLLLDQTGGIVQGMSGSPIIQNGKLVGAVTHVLINDPTRGYGIFIENMLKNMPNILQ